MGADKAQVQWGAIICIDSEISLDSRCWKEPKKPQESEKITYFTVGCAVLLII